MSGGAMLAWKATHSGNKPSVGKPKLPAGPKDMPEDAVREKRGGAMLAWKATHSGNRPSVGKPKLPAGPKGVPEDAVREKSGAAASCLPR